MRKNKLEDLVVKEVSLVPRGAAPGAHVVLRKEDTDGERLSFKARVTKFFESLGELIAKTDLEEVPGDEAPPPTPPAVEAPVNAELKKEYDDKIAALEARIEKAEAEKAEIAKAENERVAKAEQEAADAKAAVAKAEEEKAVSVAKELLGNVAGEPATLAAVLKQVDEPGREFIGTLLKSHNALLETSGVLKELGGNGEPEPPTPSEKLAKEVESVMKADTNLTPAQATAKVLKQHPELYAATLPTSA